MGQKLTQSKQPVHPEVETFLYKYLPQFQFVKLLDDGIFIKTVLVLNENNSEPLVCQIYFKREFTESEANMYTRHFEKLKEIREMYNINSSPNVAPIFLIFDNVQKAGIVTRQHFSYNLKERLQSMPYLTNVEKKWISFQILDGLMQIHNRGHCHGDMKIENVLLSTSGSVFLSDIAPYKPAYLQQDDIGSFTYYFGSNSAIKSCYLAPERLVDKKEFGDYSNNLYNTTTQMDIFAAGAIIAELFLEDKLFDHSGLLNYKNGNFNIEPSIRKIRDNNLEDLLLKMLKPNPQERITLDECFAYFAEEVCPISFSRMFTYFNKIMVCSKYWKPDRRLSIIYRHWKQIWKVLFGLDSEVPELSQSLNFRVLNQFIMDNPFAQIQIPNYPILFNLKDDNELNLDTFAPEALMKNNNSDCLLIILKLLLGSVLNMKYTTSKAVAIEMLGIFADKVADLVKIQLIIPYLVKLLKDQSNLIRISALDKILSILNSINDTELVLPSSDYNIFDAYVSPTILDIYYTNDPTLMLAFANVIDQLCNLEQKFLQITIRSRFYNLRHQNVNNLTQRSSIYSHNQPSSKGRGEEIIQTYDNDLFEFKSTLFKIIEDILSKNEELDIQQTLIRKLPNLMVFFGRRETNNFSKFIIAHFNKKEWIIQREILKCIPSLVVILGETALNQFIVPCMELIIHNNLNELKIYEMIHTMHLLLKMEFLEIQRGVDLFKKILPYIMHPNLTIRNEVVNLASSLINLLSPGEVYAYIRPELKNYLFMPFVIITTDLIKKGIKDNISRIIYELEVRDISYSFQRTIEDEEGLQFLQIIINIAHENMKFNEEIGNNTFDAQLVRLRVALEGIPLSSIVRREFMKYMKECQDNEDEAVVEREFIRELITFSNILNTVVQPQSSRRLSIAFNQATDNLLSQEIFQVKYLFKALGVIIPENVIEEIEKTDNKRFLPTSSFKENSTNIGIGNSDGKHFRSASNTSQTKSGMFGQMSNWRPQGKLLNTLYQHQNQSAISSVEKLLHVPTADSNKFLSFSKDGQVILWDIASNEGDFSVEPMSQLNTNITVEYNKTVCALDSTHFAIGTKKSIEIYNIESSKSDFTMEKHYNIPTQTEGDISCVVSGNMSQLLIYSNQNGNINVFDTRMNKLAMSYDTGVQKGILSCMDFSKDESSLYIGTLGGYIMNYDFRLNTITESYKYNDNTPIVGLQSYLPQRGKELDLLSRSANSTRTYLLVWTGAVDNEIGLWNMNTLNCDILFKVNSIHGNEIKLLTTEIPSLTKELSRKEMQITSQYNIDILYNNLSRYTHMFSSNYTKGILLNNIHSDFYSHSNKRLSKFSNLFDLASTVQTVVSPLNNKSYSLNAENVPYLISAGNDMVIRYWDIAKENLLNSNNRSYLINAPNKIEGCLFVSSMFDSTVILQSNESQNMKIPKKENAYFSEYQNYNGVTFHLIVQNEFDENLEVLKYCTKISDAAHKNTVTDLLTVNLNNSQQSLLLSSSWDGTIKIWK